MKKRWIAAGILVIGIAAGTAIVGGPEPKTPPVPVLVELFTSQGCSSCPVADALLRDLDKSQPISGAEIITLSEHVDYWNQLGWVDPFSSEAFTLRQAEYAVRLGGDGLYTPQMIVDGRTEFVGGDRKAALSAIRAAALTAKADVVVRSAGLTDAGTLDVDVRITDVPSAGGSLAHVVLAVVESEAQSAVSHGENAGRRLRHTCVVRDLRQIGEVPATGSGTFSTRTSVPVPSGTSVEDLRLVVFVQEPTGGRILGAGITD